MKKKSTIKRVLRYLGKYRIFSYIIIGNGIGNSGGSVVYSDSTG